MSVGGSYLAFQLRIGALPFFRVYKESILEDVMSGFTNLQERADEVADAAFKRLGSRPATSDSGDMSQEADWAHEEGQAYYEAMTGLRQATINLLAVGLFHSLEQHLAKLTFDRKFQDIHMEPDSASLHLTCRFRLSTEGADVIAGFGRSLASQGPSNQLARRD